MKYLLITLCFGLFSLSCSHLREGQSSSIETGVLIRSTFAPKELSTQCETLINDTRTEIKNWQQSFVTNAGGPKALLAYEEILANFSDRLTPLTFLASVSTVSAVRDESAACDESSSNFYNEIVTDKNIYNILKTTQTTDSRELRLLKETLFNFEMNGMSLSDSNLKEFKTIKDRLSKLSIDFEQNLNNDKSFLVFSGNDLEGAKPDFLNRLKKDEKGLFIVTTKMPDFIHVMENVKSGEIRKKMLFAYNNRQAEKNTQILQETIGLREKLAKLAGFSTFADYSLREKMAGTSHTVYDFLNGLTGKLASQNKLDLSHLREFKKNVLKDSSALAPWDLIYVANELKKKKFNLDLEALRKYFPADHVVPEILKIYSKLLGVEFQKIENPLPWATNVDLYRVSDSEKHELLGYFYTDLFPREGKYGHAAAFTLRSGRDLGDVYLHPVSSIVANFSPPAPGKPVLLTHEEVETFFHEFGHIMHQVLTRAKYASLSGANVKWDFVEAPSQMLENFIWEKEILLQISENYEKRGEKIPESEIKQLQASRLFNSGLDNTRQLVLALFDMNIHSNGHLDVTREYERVYKTLTGMTPMAGAHFPATFGHLMGGYAAGYYGYLWSKVYAADIYSKFAEAGSLSSELGLKYRHQILEVGNMQDPHELLVQFLGREPNSQAFFKSLGISE